MKAYLVIPALFGAMLLNPCASCSSKHDDSTENAQSKPTDDEMTARAIEVFNALPDHGYFHKSTKDCMSAEFYHAAEEAFAIPGNNPGKVGAEKDIKYWYQGKAKFRSDGIQSVEIVDATPTIVNAVVTYKNLGNDTAHQLRLAKVDGKWVAVDFDGMNGKLRKYIQDRREEYAGKGARELLASLDIEPHSELGEKFLAAVAKYKHRYSLK